MILAVAVWWLELFSFDPGIKIHFIRPSPLYSHTGTISVIWDVHGIHDKVLGSPSSFSVHIRKRGTGFAVKPRRWCLYQLMFTAHATFFQHVLNNINIKNQEFCQSLTKQGEICKTFLPISAQS